MTLDRPPLFLLPGHHEVKNHSLPSVPTMKYYAVTGSNNHEHSETGNQNKAFLLTKTK
jgi:hypothetical protein